MMERTLLQHSHLAPVFSVSLNLQILHQFQPHILNFTGLKDLQWHLGATNEFRSLYSFIIINSYSQLLGRRIFNNELKVLIPDWIQFVILNI